MRASAPPLLCVALSACTPEVAGALEVPRADTETAAVADAAPAEESSPRVEAAETPPFPQIEMWVAPSVGDELVPLAKAAYTTEELGPLFATLREASRPVCRHKRKKSARLKDAAAEAYLARPEKFFSRKLRRQDMIAGCWNFVRMNDRRPERDLELVAKLYPAASYDCSAVGVMQPYLMQKYLGHCARIDVVDFDWAIHDVHWQLLQRYADGRMQADVDRAVADMDVSWIAYHGATERHEMNVDTFCREESHALCRETLVEFGASLAGEHAPEQVTFNVAALYDAKFPEVPAGRQRVLYLSNAIENAYTSRRQFGVFLDNVAASMREGEMAVMVHHAGGRLGFGLYELHKTREGHEVRTRCKDDYKSSVSVGSTYESWFERVTVTPDGQIRGCTKMLEDQG